MATVNEEPTTRGVQPRALIVTVYGLYAREARGWLSVASIIRLLAEVGVDEPAVRSSISRLKRRGILLAERSDGQAGYGLSSAARVILDEGDRRIFQRRRASTDEGWVLAIFSVPESERDKRHLLRSRLSWLGFGTVAAGVWIAPAHLHGETRDVLLRHELADYVDLFAAEHLAFADIATQVQRWWDLPRLHALYANFLERYEPLIASYENGPVIEPRDAFADYVTALTEWRRLPYSDPGLASEILPADWNGVRAGEVFFALRDRLKDAAHDYVAGQITALVR